MHGRGQLGKELGVGVENLDLDLDCATGPVPHRDHLTQPATVPPGGNRADGYLRRLADLNPRHQSFGDVGLDVHFVEVGDRDHGRAAQRRAHRHGRDDLTLFPLLFDNGAIERGVEMHRYDRRLDLVDIGLHQFDAGFQGRDPCAAFFCAATAFSDSSGVALF